MDIHSINSQSKDMQTPLLGESESQDTPHQMGIEMGTINDNQTPKLPSNSLFELNQDSWYLKMDVKERHVNYQLLGLMLLSWILMVATLEIEYDSNQMKMIENDVTAELFKIINSAVTLIMLWRLVALYRLKLSIKRRIMNSDFSLFRMFWFQSRWYLFALEVFVLIWHPLPFLHSMDMVGLFMFFRIYLVLRVIRDASDVYRRRREIRRMKNVSSNVDGEKVEVGWLVALKTLIYRNTLSFTIVVTLTAIVIFSYSIYVCERELNDSRSSKDVFSIGTAPYFTSITMSTIGYGDMTPLSNWGRGVSVMAGLTGIVLSSFLVAVISNRLSLNQMEQSYVDWLRLDALANAERKASAKLIIGFIKRGLRMRHMAEGLAVAEGESIRGRKLGFWTLQLIRDRRAYNRARKKRLQFENTYHANDNIDSVLLQRLAMLERQQDTIISALQDISKQIGKGKAKAKS